MFALALGLATWISVALISFAALLGSRGFVGPSIPWPVIVVTLALMLAALALVVPVLALLVRRFHDQNLSGWWVLLGFIPYLGGFILLLVMTFPGTSGPNRFGPDPDGGGDTVSDVFM